jgi:hypothetical protein
MPVKRYRVADSYMNSGLSRSTCLNNAKRDTEIAQILTLS